MKFFKYGSTIHTEFLEFRMNDDTDNYVVMSKSLEELKKSEVPADEILKGKQFHYWTPFEADEEFKEFLKAVM